MHDYKYFSSGKDIEGCKEECLRNCSCTAYAYVNGIGCLVWTGELIDMQEFSLSGEDVFVRLDHSELGDLYSLFFSFFFILVQTQIFLNHHFG